MANYVDGFVLPVPRQNLETYRRLSRKAGKVWRDHGALEYRECVYEDTKAKRFLALVKPRRGETVVFSWIVYKSRAQRDRVVKKVLADPRMAEMMSPGAMPFDAERMAYGGFQMFVDM